MGLPVGKLVCASNKNNILTDFITSGVYDRNRKFYPTMSPSMDILISSNLERLLYILFGSERCAMLMKQLSDDGRYALSDEELKLLNNSFVGYYTDEDACMAAVKNTYEMKNRLIDTHTAVAVHAAEEYMSDYKATSAMLVVSTASAYKFAGDVLLSVSGAKPESDLDAPDMLYQFSGVEIPSPLKSVLTKKPIHTGSIEKEKMPEAVFAFALKN